MKKEQQEIFPFSLADIDLQFPDTRVKITCIKGVWNCTCDNFKIQKECEHVSNTQNIFNDAWNKLLNSFKNEVRNENK